MVSWTWSRTVKWRTWCLSLTSLPVAHLIPNSRQQTNQYTQEVLTIWTRFNLMPKTCTLFCLDKVTGGQIYKTRKRWEFSIYQIIWMWVNRSLPPLHSLSLENKQTDRQILYKKLVTVCGLILKCSLMCRSQSLVSVFLAHSTSFSPNFSDPQQWNVFKVVNQEFTCDSSTFCFILIWLLWALAVNWVENIKYLDLSIYNIAEIR